MVEGMERKRQRQRKGKEWDKGSGPAKQEDEVKLDAGRFSLYEDLSEYEKEWRTCPRWPPSLPTYQTQ